MGQADDTPFYDPRKRKPVILVVEDEILIRLSLADHLESCGYDVLEASNAPDAIRVIENSPVKIDLIFSDVRMPGEIDGIGLFVWVKNNRPGIPIFLASADATKAELAKQLCVDDPFFAKPYDVKVVAARIGVVLAALRSAN